MGPLNRWVYPMLYRVNMPIYAADSSKELPNQLTKCKLYEYYEID